MKSNFFDILVESLRASIKISRERNKESNIKEDKKIDELSKIEPTTINQNQGETDVRFRNRK